MEDKPEEIKEFETNKTENENSSDDENLDLLVENKNISLYDNIFTPKVKSHEILDRIEELKEE